MCELAFNRLVTDYKDDDYASRMAQEFYKRVQEENI